MGNRGANLSKIIGISILAVAPAEVGADASVSPNAATVSMQAYLPDLVVVFGAGSECYGGKVQMDTAAGEGARNRFWSTFLTAKQAGKKVNVSYEQSSGQCNVTSFSIQ